MNAAVTGLLGLTGNEPLAVELRTWQGLRILQVERAEQRSYPRKELLALLLSFCPTQNEGLCVNQLHTAPKNASKHLETRQTMDSVSREPGNNIKIPCESEKFYFILDSSRPRKSHSPFSLHQNVISREEARKEVNT